MAQLAIRGHATRGREVIELLEMLGGVNNKCLHGVTTGLYYFIDYKEICSCESVPDTYIIFTLEEFLEKFPYKVGDKVTYDGDKANIVGMVWDDINDVFYEIQVWDDVFKCPKVLLQPYKEETMEEKIEAFEILESHCKDEVKIEFDPSKFEMVERENGYYVVRKKPKYPKTYEDCCEIMGIDVSRTIEHDDCPFYKDVTCYENALLSSLVHLRKLLVCRDAYWKIAGEEMGLGKPWEPDWINNYQKKWIISFYQCEINFTTGPNVQFFLAFPTDEMRDTFYENFKNEIEQCKELI